MLDWEITNQAAAHRAGLAVAAWIGMTATAAACYEVIPVPQFQRDVIRELITLRGLAGRAGNLLNQPVAKLNATGVADPRLGQAAAWTERVMRRIDQAVTELRQRM